MTTSIPAPIDSAPEKTKHVIALVGNPNAGKTTLFNQLTGTRAKTSNFAGTTVNKHVGYFSLGKYDIELVDLPGLYSLDLVNAEEIIAQQAVFGELITPSEESPVTQTGITQEKLEAIKDKNEQASAILAVVDVTNLTRNLFLVGQLKELGKPLVIALNMMDVAQREGISVDAESLCRELETPVVLVSARTGDGLDNIKHKLNEILDPAAQTNLNTKPDDNKAVLPATESNGSASVQTKTENKLPKEPVLLNVVEIGTDNTTCGQCSGCSASERYAWAEKLSALVVKKHTYLSTRRSEQIDSWLTHPVLGLFSFALIMAGLFIVIFALAGYPMEAIEAGVGWLSSGAKYVLPDGDFESFVVDGILAGVGGVIVFLPQICLLFFILTLLEDTGYLSRGAFVMDRIMRFVGLPGKAFVPMLSAHACAIPAIIAARGIENRRDRILTILILPLLTCSARLPVYSMIAALLFWQNPIYAGLVFFGAYSLGIITALCVAFVFKLFYFKGKPQPLLIELPNYKKPNFLNAMIIAYERGLDFIIEAGTIILLISVVLWGLMTFPKLSNEQLKTMASEEELTIIIEQEEKLSNLNKLEIPIEEDEAKALSDEIEETEAQLELLTNGYKLRNSIAGRIGLLIEPVFAPLGYDWRIDIGVLSSFAARETFVATMAIIFQLDEETAEDSGTLAERLRKKKRPNGEALFDVPTCFSLLVFYVLAMQCLPTQAVTKSETGKWSWAIFQLVYMTLLAYGMAFLAYHLAKLVVG